MLESVPKRWIMAMTQDSLRIADSVVFGTQIALGKQRHD